MAWNQNQPVATDSLATSAPLISGNFIQIQAVLGSSTLSAGISKVQGDILYVSDTERLQRLAKASAAGYYLSSEGTSQNPSWFPLNSITALTGLSSVGTINSGVWKGTISASSLSAAVDKSADYGAQLAPSDGFVVVNVYATGTGENYTYAYGYTDSNADPTTLYCKVAMNDPSGAGTYQGMMHGTFTMPVKKGNYWKVVCAQTYVSSWSVRWVPMGA